MNDTLAIKYFVIIINKVMNSVEHAINEEIEKKVLPIKVLSGITAVAIMVLALNNTIFNALPYYMQTVASMYLV